MTKKLTDIELVRYESLDEVPADHVLTGDRTNEQIRLGVASDPDAVDTSAPGFWENAEVKMPTGKGQITLRIDRDVLEWFKDGGKGYQTRINAVLRSYMEARKP